MAGGDAGGGSPNKNDDVLEPGSSFSSTPLSTAPILFLVYFHKALRSELSDLRRIAFLELEKGSFHRELLLQLRPRFEFVKLVYKYHCAAEDEVIFLALDTHITNVVHAYSIEHESIDNLFEAVFHYLDLIKEDAENISKLFQELVFSIGTMHTSICKHMLKEEEQVFPLLIEQFSSTEQAAYIWQFICSVPIVLLEDILPWTLSFLCPDEQVEVTNCIKNIVPHEKLLQEVFISWLGGNNKDSTCGESKIGQGAQNLGGSANVGSGLRSYASNFSFGENKDWKKGNCLQSVGDNPIDGLNLWHSTITKDFKEIIEELYQIRNSSNFSNLDAVILQLKFLADALIFYSNAQEKFFYPTCLLSSANGLLIDDVKLEGLQRLLHYTSQDEKYSFKFVNKLCQELDSLVLGIGKHFVFQETKVIPVISNNCSHEMQQQILYMSLHMMPLGLLKCLITWFSSHLSEVDFRFIHRVNQGDSFVNNSFASLVYKWFRIGYSGKTSVEQFRKDLQEMFKSRCSFLSEKTEEHTRCSSLHSNAVPIESLSTTGGKNCMPYSASSGSSATKKYDTSYSSGINMNIFFPGMDTHFPEFLGEMLNEPQPMDLLFFFHKALKKDLEYLVHGSSQLAENVGFVVDFKRRFQLICFLYKIHTDAEDEIAFPALEAKGKLQNISQSYSIDHKMDDKYFNDISITLDEMYGFHTSIPETDTNTQDHKMLKYHQLCMNLHDLCKSVYKIVSDHTHREEVELWPIFRKCFSVTEQEKIICCMLGRTSAEILQDMIPWLMASLTPEEQHNMMFLWRKATKNTMFDDWLREWWEGYNISPEIEESNISHSSTSDQLDHWKYLSQVLSEHGQNLPENGKFFQQKDFVDTNSELFGKSNENCPNKINDDQHNINIPGFTGHFLKSGEKGSGKIEEVTAHVTRPGQILQVNLNSVHQQRLLTMSQEDLEAAIRKVSRDSSLNAEKKACIIQNLLTSRWIVAQQKYPSQVAVSSNDENFPGQCPSYRDPIELTFGCKHYRRNCKLVAACCNQLYTCKRCHDEMADHSLERKSITQMMCMKCLIVQPIGAACSTTSCNGLSMAKYYCKICKLHDDEREIYHCPYCNLCRVGEGLGIDYFHCMNCNACMSRSLSVHICREKCFEDNCPICHEFIFTSNSPIKALACGHLMHSACFRDYTCSHYTCPICGKSLGDMQVYFNMLDALLAEEKIPDDYSKQAQEFSGYTV